MKRVRMHQQQLSFPGGQVSEQIVAANLREARQLLARLLNEVVTAEHGQSEVSDEREDPARSS
jgi:hypothetical protein